MLCSLNGKNMHVRSFLNICLAFALFRFCVVIRFFSSPPQRPMSSDLEGFLYQILSITFFSYLNLEKEPVFQFQCWVLNKGTTGNIVITYLVWRGPWLGIEPGTPRTRYQHSTTRLSRRRLRSFECEVMPLNLITHTSYLNARLNVQNLVRWDISP